MMRPRATLLMGTVDRGEYIVDVRAVAEAIVRRIRRRRRSEMLEAAQPGQDVPVRAHEREVAPGANLA